MPKRKTIHIGITEATKLGKPLWKYLVEDAEELNDFQDVYLKGYKDALDDILEKLDLFIEKNVKTLSHMEKTVAECKEIIRSP